jgi:hypothetical protein
MSQYVLEQRDFLPHTYVKVNHKNRVNKDFAVRICCSIFNFINDFRIGEKRAFNWVFVRQEVH